MKIQQSSSFNTLTRGCLLIVLLSGMFLFEVQGEVRPELYGIGLMNSHARSGVDGISFAGGAELMIHGSQLSHFPNDNKIKMTTNSIPLSPEANDLNHDDEFNSDTAHGRLAYTAPSLVDLFSQYNMKFEDFNSLNALHFYTSVRTNDAITQVWIWELECGRASNCVLGYQRSMTPIVYYLTSPVVYEGLEIGIRVNTMGTQSWVKSGHELPFVDVKFDGVHMDFEGYYSTQSGRLPSYQLQTVLGKVGDQDPNATSEFRMKFKNGYAFNMEYSMKVCEYDNQNCYYSKTIPKIGSISPTYRQGHREGGQLLTITGHGLVGATPTSQTTVTIDGLECKIISLTSTEIKCMTSKSSGTTTPSNHIGYPGLKKEYHSFPAYSHVSPSNIGAPKWSMGMTNFETVPNRGGNYFGEIISGYFKAPATTRYRFYISADDDAELWFSTTNEDPSSKTKIAHISGYSPHRNYFVQSTQKSSWVNLTQGEYYYIEAKHVENTGDDHLTVCVEIEQVTIKNHHHASREMQKLSITPQNTFEKTIYEIYAGVNKTIEQEAGGSFKVRIFSYSSAQDWEMNIPVNPTASQFWTAIKDFYEKEVGSAIHVTKKMFNVTRDNSTGQVIAMNETTNVTQAVKIQFFVTLAKVIHGRSLETPIRAFPTDTTARMKVILPGESSQTPVSSPPLSGNFRILGWSPDGTNTPCVTDDIPWSANADQIKAAILAYCPYYREDQVWDTKDKYKYYANGREIYIRFPSHNADIPQFIITSGLDQTLLGSIPVNGTLFKMETPIPYSDNPFYEPIPFEFLHTRETKPPIIVKIDGEKAICANGECDYEYVANVGDITSFTISGSSVNMTGTNLPESADDILEVTYSNLPCIVTAATNTSILCTLSKSIVSGSSWVPRVRVEKGFIPVSDTPQSQGISISNVLGISNVNPNGNQILKIQGTNFPPLLDKGDSVTISFQDGTKCILISTNIDQKEMKCKTNSFQSGTSGAQTITIDINGAISTSFSANVMASPAQIITVTPSVISPVLKSFIVLSLDNAFSGTLDRTTLHVYVLKSDGTTFKEIRVTAVDNTNGAKKITAAFGGAPSDTYKLRVADDILGDFDSSSVTVTTEGKINDFNPKAGSAYGGTLITIDGGPFSTDKLDNNVKVGKTDCLVEVSTRDQIQCRTQTKLPGKVNGTLEESLLVFLKASEEAVCGLGLGACKFTWLNQSVPVISSMSTEFDAANDYYKVTITGTNFPSSGSNAEIWIDGKQQTTITAESTTTNLVAKITDMNSHSSEEIEAYFQNGRGENFGSLRSTGISLTQKLTLISPSIGSSGGQVVTATVRGVGTQTQGLMLVDSNGNDLCEKVEIPEFEKVKCTTIAKEYSQAQNVSVKIGSGSPQKCANTDITKCQYKTITVSRVLSYSMTANTLTISGTGFPTSGFTSQVSVATINSNSVTISSSTQLVATFNLGIPNLAVIPKVQFSDGSTDTYYATNNITLHNSLSLTSSTTATCSYNGGCEISFTANGLSSTLSISDRAHIEVCGEVCKLSSTSTATQANCTLPPLATKYSADSYQITQSGKLEGSIIGSNVNQAKLVFDGNNINGWTQAGSLCYFGKQFKSGYVGILSEVKYFMNRFTGSHYIDKLSFQGTNSPSESASWSEIFTVSEEIHEGWNYHYFEEGAQPTFNAFRFYGLGQYSCIVGEALLYGVEVVSSNSLTHECTPKVMVDGQELASGATVTYSSSSTGLLASINPRFGPVTGNTEVTFTGQGFDTDQSKYSIKIDDVKCSISSVSETQIVCKTGPRPGLYENPKLEMFVAGKGLIATQGLIFRYVSYWSDETTWSGEFAPLEGESVHVPKGLSLLMDIDETPVLNVVLVEGALIFPPDPDPNHMRKFDAYYVFVHGGRLEIGTEEFRYTSKINITMHGNKFTPELPIYGNKVIAVRRGSLDMHGIERDKTWTELDVTAEAGSTSITLKEAVDWKAGEKIVIAPTSVSHWQAEERVIKTASTSGGKTTLTFDDKLSHKHYAGIQTFGQQTIEMRAEVGLLTRNVIFAGNPVDSNRFRFGAHIMLHSPGDDSLTGRISYCEFVDVGQAFQLGRYPIHFHMIGNVHNSYIKGNSIHDTYNRAVTIHGVHYLRITENVAYKTMGHTYFIEDAIETKNLVENNLAMRTHRSMSLLNTDQTPASFWITNPDNIFRGNHAAGSDRYGFWFDLQDSTTGPSFTPGICPINMPLGEFTNNVAHSNVRYGLRIFHGHVPRKYSCGGISASNPSVTATYKNFVGYKNGRNGAIVERVGDVRFENFKTADNILAGIEFSVTDSTGDDRAQINGALVIGHSDNADGQTLSSSPHGIITPRTENFRVKNVDFYNFDRNSMAALGSCSHCFHPASTDSGARTVKFEGLKFDDATVPRRIRYQTPNRAIYLDLDGSLTGLGPNTWATPGWDHNKQPECKHDSDTVSKYNGVICDSTVQVRRLVYLGYNPWYMEGQTMFVQKYDQSIIGAMNKTELANYEKHGSKSHVNFQPLTNPAKAWAMPIVTGHRYKIHWGNYIDFEQMQLQIGGLWSQSDGSINIVHQFHDVRAKVAFKAGSTNVPNNTLNLQPIETGNNVVYNETWNNPKWMEYVVNAKNPAKRSLVMTGYRCIQDCDPEPVERIPIENFTRLWSNETDWNGTGIPKEGDKAEVKPGWNMLYDIEESPILKHLEINGRLTFKDGANRKLRVQRMHVKVGELIIGSPEFRFQNDAEIELIGERFDEHFVFTNEIEAGNKILANTGLVRIYGQNRTTMGRLQETVSKGDTRLKMAVPPDWKINDTLVLAPTNALHWATEKVKIKNISLENGTIELDRPLNYSHYGAPDPGQRRRLSSNEDYNGVEMRGEVALLSRNVRIVGLDNTTYGGQVLLSDYKQHSTNEWFIANTTLDNVELYHLSQKDTYKPGIRLENARRGQTTIANCSVHQGLGRGIELYSSANVNLDGNVVHNFGTIGINVQNSKNVKINDNKIFQISRNVDETNGGLIVCGVNYGERCSNTRVTNNIVAGAGFAGIGTFGHTCNKYDENKFKNNVAHSNNGMGLILYLDHSNPTHSKCFEGSHFTAYKNTESGILTYFSSNQVRLTKMTLIGNGYNINALLGQGGRVTVDGLKVYADGPHKDCLFKDQCKSGNGDQRMCSAKYGMMSAYLSNGGKQPFPTGPAALPLYKIKAEASWGGTTDFQNLEFYDFDSSSNWCGASQKVFTMNPYGADQYPIQTYTNTTFFNVSKSAFASIMSPPLAWANLADCGNFPCTGPHQYFMDFRSTNFLGTTTPGILKPDFVVMGDNEKAAPIFGCKRRDEWNGYYCETTEMALLVFESQDGDKFDRTVSPIIMTSTSKPGEYANVMNSFMDHQWDGFYTSQRRLSRFPAIVKMDERYNISYTGTPPKKQIFTLKWNNPDPKNLQSGIVLSIDYTQAGAYQVKNLKTGKIVEENPWDEVKRCPMEIRGKGGPGCGENRFVGVDNILQFFLTASNCELQIIPRDAIVTRLRLEWTFAEFFALGGTTKFIDRIAGALGIHASAIKIVSVFQGSVIIEFAIFSPDETDPTILADIEALLKAKIANQTLDVGAPILDASIADYVVNFGEENQTSSNNYTASNDTTGNDNSTEPIIIATNETIDVEMTGEAGETKTKVAILLGSIIGVLVIFIAIVAIIYKRINNPQDRQVQALPDKSTKVDDEEIYEHQYHPKSEVGNNLFTGRDFAIKVQEQINEINDNETKGENESRQISIIQQEDGSPLTKSDAKTNAVLPDTVILPDNVQDAIVNLRKKKEKKKKFQPVWK